MAHELIHVNLSGLLWDGLVLLLISCLRINYFSVAKRTVL